MQRQYQQGVGKAKISSTKAPSAKSKKHLPKASPPKPNAKEQLVVSLNDDNFSSLLMHDDVDLLKGMKDDVEEANFAELLDGAFSDQILSEPTKPAEQKSNKVKKVSSSPQLLSQADQTMILADQTLGLTTSMFRPSENKLKSIKEKSKSQKDQVINLADHSQSQTEETKSWVEQPEGLTDQTMSWADQTLSIATSVFRGAKERLKSQADQTKIETGQTSSRTGQEKRRIGEPVSLTDKTIGLADQTLAIATSMFRPSEEEIKSRADQTTNKADQTLISGVASIFRPVNDVKLDEDEDVYFGRKGRVKVDYSIMQTAPATKYSLLGFFFFVGIALLLGWFLRGEELLSAESGMGYTLGIVGGSMMLVLVLYPLRKKFSIMNFLGPIKFWFYIHMVFGTMGPALILFHANFSVGSLNSQVALAFTILVAASGFFHMYIYTKVHYQLHGKKMTLQELQEKTEVNRSSLEHIFEYAPQLKKRLREFEDEVLAPPLSVLESILRVLTIGFRIRLNYLIIIRGLKRGLEIVFERAGWPTSELEGQHLSNKNIVKEHMKAILKIVELSFYERLFAQWYLFHGPLFFMLIFVAIIHVIAVHMY